MKRVRRQGTWWSQPDDGSWVRWDESAKQWVPDPTGPPDPTPEELEFENRIAAEETQTTRAGNEEVSGALKPLSGLAKWSQRLLLVMAGLLLATILVDIAEWSFVDRLERGEYTDPAAAEEAGWRIDVAWLIVLAPAVIAFLAHLIIFLRWFSRAYENLEHMKRPRSFKMGWAIGAWFVPILNLFRPKQIADEIWRGSHSTDSVPVFVHWWWACWIISTFADRISSSLYDESLGDWKTSIVFSAISTVGFVAAAVLLRRYIKEVTGAQERLSA